MMSSLLLFLDASTLMIALLIGGAMSLVSLSLFTMVREKLDSRSVVNTPFESDIADYFFEEEFTLEDVNDAVNHEAPDTPVTYWEQWNRYCYVLFSVVTPLNRFADKAQAGRHAVVMLVTLYALALVVTRSLLFAAVIVSVAAMMLHGQIRRYLNRRERQVQEQLVYFLPTLQGDLAAGKTLDQSLLERTPNQPSPIGDDLRLVTNQIAQSIPLMDALENARNQAKSISVRQMLRLMRHAVKTSVPSEEIVPYIKNDVEYRRKVGSKIETSKIGPAIIMKLALIFPALVFFASIYTNPSFQAFWFNELFFSIPLGIVIFGFYMMPVLLGRKKLKRLEWLITPEE